ncbi:MAG: neuraminidase-like domain-containing protein [Desulfocapsaceae bacterium]|nr:neuraminidase-like domain-containing protein [Desulfocapsaceae bacterium]
MNKVTFPLKQTDKGSEVANLQDALKLMLEREAIYPGNPRTRAALFAKLPPERQTQTYGTTTSTLVKAIQEERQLRPDGIVGKQTADIINMILNEWGVIDAPIEPGTPAYQVSGKVQQADASPLAGALVCAFDKDLRHEQLLGEASTDRQGRYAISYTQAQFRRSEKQNADLIVRVLGPDGAVLAESPVVFNAQQVETIDIAVGGMPREFSEYERLVAEITPLLEGVALHELKEDEIHQDISFLAGETGIEARKISRLTHSHRLSVESKLPPEFWYAVLGLDFCIGLENLDPQEQYERILRALPVLDAVTVRKALNLAFAKNIISPAPDKVPRWISDFIEYVSRQVVGAGDADTATFAKLAMVDAGITNIDKQQKFARLFYQHRKFTAALAEELNKDESFKPSEIADIHTSYRIAELTNSDYSAVKVIKKEFDIRQPDAIRNLAKKSEKDWIQLVEKNFKTGEMALPFGIAAPAEMSAQQTELYGKELARQFQEAFPTTAYLGRLEQGLREGLKKPALRHADTLQKFLNENSDFEFLHTSIDGYFQAESGPDLTAYRDNTDFHLELKAVQRVFKVAPSYEATNTLLADGLHSGQKIYRMGKSKFVQIYKEKPGFNKKTAIQAWNKAANTHAAVISLVSELKAWEQVGDIAALNIGNDAVSGFPNWETLFHSGDSCDCVPCRSVLSPAAYFTDLLMFLKDRDSNDGILTVKDILFKRRADLGNLELNCDNALTHLPYIDVACEVLEDVVDGADSNDLELRGLVTIPADTDKAKAAVEKAFQDAFKDIANKDREKNELGGRFELSQVKPSDPDRWVVHGDGATYLLKKEAPSHHFFAKILRNTKASAAELRAYPQYLNPLAYDKLKNASYPMSLPFDLFAEEVRAGFQKNNLQRWDLMRAFRGTAKPNDPTEGDIAAEYFGISSGAAMALPDEKNIICEAKPTAGDQKIYWGETGSDWLDKVANVKNFLRKTNLEYNELLALLDLKFINPAGDIGIHHHDSSCDTDQKCIQVLDANKLDRIHRFMRLWRKLKGWKMWELDLVICNKSIGKEELNESLLINIFYLSEIRKKLGSKTTVEQLCALFGDLNTATHFTGLHEKREEALYQSLFLNKRRINPLDPAFNIDAASNDILPVLDPVTHLLKQPQLSERHPILLAALGIKEADLAIFKALVKPSSQLNITDQTYITDDLTLSNLSFLWRHSWLSKQLKFKSEEWEIALKIFHEDITQFSDPKTAWKFLEKIGYVKATGFSYDELNWLLACDPTAKAAVKETDAARFLSALRKELQTIKAEYSIPLPKEEDQLVGLLSSLLLKLGWDEARVQFAQTVLRGSFNTVFEVNVSDLPNGFTFPASISGVPIEYDESKKLLRFTGLLTENLKSLLLSDASLANVMSDSYKQAVDELYRQSVEAVNQYVSMEAIVNGLPAGFTFPLTVASIPIRYEPVLRFTGAMTVEQQTTLLNHSSLADVTGIATYQDAIAQLFKKPGTVKVASLPAGFNFPKIITDDIPICYEPVMRFTGMMTVEQKTTLLNHSSLADVTSIPAYQQSINEWFQQSGMAVKFFEPVFTDLLEVLPPTVDFVTQLPPELAARISYDTEQRLLRFVGVMSDEEQLVLDSLVSNQAYQNAVASLKEQPQTIALPDNRIWLAEDDLDPSLPDNDSHIKRVANATQKALDYLSRTLVDQAVVLQCSTQLGQSEILTRFLLDAFAILPPLPTPPNTTLLTHLTKAFSLTQEPVNYTIFKETFDGWFWINRVAAILKKWKITLYDLKNIMALAVDAKLLNFQTFPLDEKGEIVPVDSFLNTSRLLRFRDSLPETGIPFWKVLEKLHSKAYAQEAVGDPATSELKLFAADVELLDETWSAADLEKMIASSNLVFPGDYLLVETWERLQRMFYYLGTFNAGAKMIKDFAAPAMTLAHAKTLKELLRSKFGTETWMVLSAEIQDILRERKRDALAAYLLNQPKPGDAPFGKWENTNDLYAYYLLDIEMSSCQMTSRLVQGSGSIQLFVQRCMMGLESNVTVKTDGDDGDSCWLWWKWMSKYRVWEANRKVFLYPENWIEPELRKDSSPFFKDLENELLQNEVNQYTVESAFLNYLDKLDGVARLEIAGFYHEDDADRTFIHVFGRTKGAEQHIYYYRRYDYSFWTPWEKVDLDIASDYLIPAVVNKRLFLFWPVFTEVPDEAENETITLPSSDDQSANEFTPDKTKKKLRLQLAVSEFRQGKWVPKKVSSDYLESGFYAGEIEKKYFTFWPVDRSEIAGRFGIGINGVIEVTTDTSNNVYLGGTFELSGCKGVPEKTGGLGSFRHYLIPDQIKQQENNKIPAFMKYEELEEDQRNDGENDFAFVVNGYQNQKNNSVDAYLTSILVQTPSVFNIAMAWHPSFLDKFILDIPHYGEEIPSLPFLTEIERSLGKASPIGTWLPFFYADQRRTFFVRPGLFLPGKKEQADLGEKKTPTWAFHYYPDIKDIAKQIRNNLEDTIRANWKNFPANLNPQQRQIIENFLKSKYPEYPNLNDDKLIQLTGEILCDYFDEENTSPNVERIVELIVRFLMQWVNLYLGFVNLGSFNFRYFHFQNYYHPFVCDFIKTVSNPLEGIPALMSRKTQMKNTGFSFSGVYQPTDWVFPPSGVILDKEDYLPKEDVDFAPDGAYSPYNWELFYHAPLMIANRLSQNQRFEEAMQWYHYIFNPIGMEGTLPDGTAAGTPQKYWITKPFFLTTDEKYKQQRIDSILNMLSGDNSSALYDDLVKRVRDWRDYPFEPHRIAQYRNVAFQKTTVMKYLDNLVAWGDYLFRQDSMESINEATQLYVLAAEILGPRPKKIPPQAKPVVETFNELVEDGPDSFSNAMIQVENLIPAMSGDGQDGSDSAPLPMLYFCIPQNDKMLGYWDTIADRLYKIRHGMNIEGVVRQLALFEPPIDPAALVKAVAGGLDISSALADLSAPLPIYRFNVLLQKANEVCNDVKALGGALLSALEKKDAEEMGLLRQGQEIRMLEAVKAVREKQIEEAKENLAGVTLSRSTVEERRNFYRDVEYLSTWESASMVTHGYGILSEIVATVLNATAGTAHLIPKVTLGVSGFGGSPLAIAQFGGDNLGDSAFNWAAFFSGLGGTLHSGASLMSTQASNERRWNEWKLQERLADKELLQIDKSIAAADLRITIAEKELENHILQIENAKATDEYMRSKYTSKELYQWQVGQISGVYFQSYKLAYDLAKRAERCFRFELGLQDSSYINFGYWDSLKKGLLSGEKLQYDLRRLETAYLEQNRREFELTKHISLAMLDPLALVKLRETGRCFFNLPEEIFDLDYPGQYFRRIKSVSLTLPCVVGPYTTISCTLRLLKNSIRVNTTNGDNGYPRNVDDQNLPADDSRFIENNTPVKAIAASNAQNDSGVFELSFRDERYLPFEGAGIVSQWSLELFSDLPANNPDPGTPDFGRSLRQFDYNTISDAIVHVKYTAREDAGVFKNGAITHLRDYFGQEDTTPSLRMLNLRQEFPTEWHRFLNPANPVTGNIFELELKPELFAFRDQEHTLVINTICLLARCTKNGDYNIILTIEPETTPIDMKLAKMNQFGDLYFSQKKDVGIVVSPADPPAKWQLSMFDEKIKELVEEIFLVLGYNWDETN